MDIQAAYRSIDLKFSDDSTIEAEVYIKLSTGDTDSIANELIDNFMHSNALDPMEGIVRALLSEDNETESDETDGDETELTLEEDDEL